jgi:Na+/H+ antiporter NhaC
MMTHDSSTPGQRSIKTTVILRVAIGTAIFAVVCVLAQWWAGQRTDGNQIGLWYGIVPALSAITLAFVTRRVLLSLGLAIILGGLLSHLPGNLTSGEAWRAGLYAGPSFLFDAIREPANLQILFFVPPMFALVLIIAEAGGFDGILVHVQRIVKGRKSAQFATASAGVLYFFDDYSNAMVVGSAMRPLTDRYRISREKLAFLVDSTSAPIASLALISTWIMYEVTLFGQSAETMGIADSGYSIFLDVLRYRFYCLFILAWVFLHIILGRDFGPMRAAEERALRREPDVQADDSTTVKSRALWVALIPLTGLLLFHFVGIWYDGGGLQKLRDGASLTSWVYWREVIGSSEQTILIFDFAALFGLCLAILSASCLVQFPFRRIAACLWRGISKSVVPCLILTFAWSLKNSSDALDADDFLVALLTENVSLVFLPCLVFLVACLTSFTTGTSWGTMAILIPIVGPVAFQLEQGTYGLITMISLGAVLDGAIFGDHCSPISDTTILSSSATQCDLMQHVRTQMPYSVVGAAIALLCGYLPVAFGFDWIVSFVLGLLAVIGLILFCGTPVGAPPAETS